MATFASPYADTITGTSNADFIDALGGNDTVRGNGGDDTLYGGEGWDTLYGDAGDDILCGWNGNDTLDGGVDNDYLDGEGGNDILKGGDGNDTLVGDWRGSDRYLFGNDTLIGGMGTDLLLGGEGADTFQFDKPEETWLGSVDTTIDTIDDFSKLEGDKIDLRKIDANTTNGSWLFGYPNDAFSWKGDIGASGRPLDKGQLGYKYDAASDTTYLYGNTDGDLTYEVAIKVSGYVPFSSNDFVSQSGTSLL